MDHLVQKEFINVQGDGNGESSLLTKAFLIFKEIFTLRQKNAKLRRIKKKAIVTPFPAKPDITHLLYQRLITNLQSDVLYLRQQLKTSDVFFQRRDYLPPKSTWWLSTMFLLFIKKGKNASIHQKRKPYSVETSSASENIEKKKIASVKAKKNSSSG